MRNAEKERLKSSAVKGVIWTGMTKLLGQSISWFSTIFILRILSPDDYGLMGMATVFLSLVQHLNEMGLGAAIVHEEKLTRKDLSTIFWFNLAIGIGFYLMIFSMAPFIAMFFQNEKIALLIRVLGVSLVLGSLRAVPFSMLIKEMSFDKKSKAEMASNLISGVTALILAYAGYGVWSLAISFVILNISLTAFVIYYYPWRPDLVFHLGRVRELLRFGRKVLASRLLFYGYGKADFLIIGKILGERSVGFYSIAADISGRVIDVLSEILSQVSFSFYAKLQGDPAALRRYFLKLSKLVSLIGFPIFIGLILVGPDLFSVLLTEQWLSAVPIFQILCAAALVKTLAIVIPPFLLAIGRADIQLKYTFLCALVMPLSFAFGSIFGLSGIAYAWLVIYPFLFFYVLRRVLKINGLGFKLYLKEILPAASSSAVMALLVIFFQSWIPSDQVIVRLAGSCLLGSVGYVVFAHLAFQGLDELSFILPHASKLLMFSGALRKRFSL